MKSMFTAALKPQAVLLLALLVAVLVLLFPSYGVLHAMWMDADNHTYTHGYLIFGICLWLVWRALPRVLVQKLSPAPWLLLPLAGAAAAWAVALTAGIQDIHLLLLPVIVWLAVAAAFGLRAGSELLLPIGFIVFALPAWSSGNFILQQITVWANNFLIWLTGMTVLVHGNTVQLPAGVIEIADGCSGLHFFIVGLSIAVLYGELGRDSLRRRAEWVVLAAALSMLANWLRVFTITVAGYLTDMQHYLVRVDHYKFGWLVFAGTLMVFFWIANRRAAEPLAAPAPPVGQALPLVRNAAAASAALLVAGVFGLLAWRATEPTTARAAISALAATAPPAATSGWAPVYPGASATSLHGINLEGAQVDIYQAIYSQQRQGAEMVGGGSSLFGNERIDVVAERTLQDATGPWREWQIMGRGGLSLVRAHWQIGGRAFAKPAASQLWYGVVRLFRPVTSRVVALRTQCAESCAAAQTALDEAGKLLPSQTVSLISDTGIGR